MRRILANSLGVAAIPVGVGVGLWMAQLTTAPFCPVKGLGTAYLCAPSPALAPSTCVVAGAAAAAVLVLLSIAILRPAASLARVFDLAAAAAGILIGVWASLIVAYPAGIGGVYFTSWESALIGAAAAIAILALGCIASSDIRRANLSASRRAQGWLFKDLSMSSAIEGQETNAG
jgi:hypothetical protein